MPSPSYAQNKKSIYTWREKPDNHERHNTINRNHMRRKRDWVKIATIFFNILLI